MVRPECQGIADQLQDARRDLTIAQEDFLAAERNSQVKQQARAEVIRLYNLVQELERSLRDCEGLPPFPQPVRALFTSTVVVNTSNPVIVATRTQNVQASMTFSSIDYRLVEFTFPDTPVATTTGGIGPVTGTNTIFAKTPSTVVGAFERSTGHIDMQTARFDVRNDVDFLENGTADFMPLTTRTVPSPNSGSLMGTALGAGGTPGGVVLVGSSVFRGGVGSSFNGTSIDLTINGVLSDFPRD
jgi:hypothetical protein